METSFAVIAETWLRGEEGYRRFVYLDTEGIPTIGYGRNLKDVGINRAEADYLLRNDLEIAVITAVGFSWFDDLSVLRKAVILDMLFNLGLPRFKTFKKMILAVVNKDYRGAAIEMLDSKWARQVGKRADKLAYAMRNNREMPA